MGLGFFGVLTLENLHRIGWSILQQLPCYTVVEEHNISTAGSYCQLAALFVHCLAKRSCTGR